MRKIVLVAFAICLLFTTVRGASADPRVFRPSEKAAVGPEQLVEDVRRSDVIFIGDTHDDQLLHRKQLEIIQALYAKSPQLAIGLEMFTTDSQSYLDDWTSGKVEEKDFIPIYSRNWSYDWPLYRDFFLFARDKHIPMIALNVPKQLISTVVRQGANGLSESDKKALPPGGIMPLNPRQAEYLRRIREQAFAGIPPRFPVANFEAAQALRNDTMAYNIMKFRDKAPKSKVVVIAGTWHAIKNGAPESLKKYGSATYKVILPDLVEFAWLKPTVEDVDYFIPRGE